MFTRGIMHVQMKGVKSCSLLVNQIFQAVLSNLELTRDEKQTLVRSMLTKDATTDYLISFFNMKQDLVKNLKKQSRISQNQSGTN